MAKNAGLQAIMLKYVQAFLVQTSHTAICNARSHIDAAAGALDPHGARPRRAAPQLR